MAVPVDLGKAFMARVALPYLDVRRGTDSLARYRAAMRNTRRPLEELRSEQWARVRALIDHAYRNVPHYHDAFRRSGVAPGDIRTPEDFRRVPILSKETIQQEPGRLRSTDAVRRRPVPNSTGGSTGQPLQYVLDRASLGWMFAMLWRGWGYGGYELGDRRATLAGLSVLTPGEGMRKTVQTRLLDRNLALPATRLDPPTVRDYVRRLRSWRPRFLMGYPSAIVQFCRAAREELQGLGLRGVCTNAEMLYPHERADIEEVLGCPVLDGYGANDGGVSAFECGEHPGYHVDQERGLLEVVADGEPAAPGERGEVLATDLHNYSMPFIRYAIGDVAVPSGERGSCGRTLPLLDRIEGRTTDLLVFRGGVIVSGPSIVHAFKDLALDDYLVEQLSDSRIQASLVTRPGGTTPEHVEAVLRRNLGADVEVAVKVVDAIPRRPGGKRRFIVSSLARGLR